MNNIHWSIIVVLVLLSFAVGFMYCKMKKKFKDDIIKLQIKQDLLPEPGIGGPWIQGGSCWMEDGGVGVVKGRYCQQMNVL